MLNVRISRNHLSWLLDCIYAVPGPKFGLPWSLADDDCTPDYQVASCDACQVTVVLVLPLAFVLPTSTGAHMATVTRK
jgi:hypothetical protein